MGPGAPRVHPRLGRIDQYRESMPKKYSNPPIIEAVCEFRLAPETHWDLTVPGLLYEKLKGEYPNKREVRLIEEIQFNTLEKGQPLQIRQSERIQFLANNEKRFIQVGPRILAINILKPYPHWEVFQPQIAKAIRGLNEIAPINKFQRIGLRYINKIEIPKGAEISDYFEFRPFLGNCLKENIFSEISLGCSFSFSNSKEICRTNLKSVAPERENFDAYILDFDYYLNRPHSMSISEAVKWVEMAHQRIENLFEGCIKDNLRKSFGEND